MHPTNQQQPKIKDIKNLTPNCKTSLSNHPNKGYFNTTVDTSDQHEGNDEYEKRELRGALCEAIEENEVLRERITELEALLAAAQDLLLETQ